MVLLFLYFLSNLLSNPGYNDTDYTGCFESNTKPDLTFNVLKAFNQLEAAEVHPSLLTHSSYFE